VIGKLLNAIGYQLVWFVSAVGAAHGLLYAGPSAAAVFVMLMLAFGGERRADLRLIPLVLLIGLLTDSAWIGLGWLDYSAPWPSAQFAPAWIVGIWASFAVTLNHSMAFLKRRYLLAAALGAVGGPFAYWGASRGLGAVHFNAPATTVLVGLGIVWMCVFPLFARLSETRRSAEARVVLP
jgi:hypothetical protein